MAGRMAPFIELGVGFNHDLTARENVVLNGVMMGLTPKEMRRRLDAIIEFAELDEFADLKLKNYSSGMQVRLAFSIAIRAKGDILLLDEVLAVGDSAFQQKCYAYFNKLKDSGQTVVLVTHSMAAVERFCTRALLLEDGSIVKVGSSNDIAALYEDLFIDKPNKSKTVEDKSQDNSAPVVLSTKIERNGTATSDVRFGDNFSVVVDIDTKTNIKSGNVGINIRNEKGDVVFSSDTRPHIGDFNLSPGQTKQIRYNIEDRYTNGDYAVDVHLVDELSDSGVLARRRESAKFTSHGVTTHSHSLFHPEYSVEDI